MDRHTSWLEPKSTPIGWVINLIATTTALVVCAVLIGGALTGALLRHLLPDRHLDNHAKDIVRLGCALIATIAGLVFGLLINSAKSTYDAERNEIQQITANVILLDHLLEQYGPEARPGRALLRQAVDTAIDRIWNVNPDKVKPNTGYESAVASVATFRAIRELSPTTEAQRSFQNQAMQTLNTIVQSRLILHEQAGAHMPTLFLIVLVFWLAVLFASFSLFSPLNPTATGAIVVIAMSLSGAIFLILELYQPFSGIMQIGSDPLRQALASLNGPKG